jgi:YD repeat-containing protein
MKNILSALGFLFVSTCMHAQYYYNDIIGTQETNRQMKAYLSNKIRTMSATGSDRNGTRATDFSEFHEVRENGKALKATSIINLNRSIIYSRFDEQGRVTSMADSSTSIVSLTTYTYDAAGRVSRVQNTVKDSSNDFNQVETHQWYYNASGQPERMWRITVSGTNSSIDSMEVRMVTDEDGNPGEEHTYKRGIEMSYLYYYYDDKNRLTDIVRYNNKLQKLLPDLMFEYDDNDRVIQKITTTSTRLVGYLIWRYIYNDKGLKTKEALFNKDKELTGRIDYTYTYNQ